LIALDIIIAIMVIILVFFFYDRITKSRHNRKTTGIKEELHGTSCPTCGKQVKNKASLPWKTLDAVNLIIAFGILGVVVMIGWLLSINVDCGSPCMSWQYRGIGFCLVYIIPAILICIKNRIVWIFAVVILSGVTVFIPIIAAVSHFYNIAAFIYSFVIFITLILIVIDRKNYFQIIRQRELEKKGGK